MNPTAQLGIVRDLVNELLVEGEPLESSVLHDQVAEHPAAAVPDHLEEPVHHAEDDEHHRHAQTDRSHGKKRDAAPAKISKTKKQLVHRLKLSVIRCQLSAFSHRRSMIGARSFGRLGLGDPRLVRFPILLSRLRSVSFHKNRLQLGYPAGDSLVFAGAFDPRSPSP